MSRLLTLLLAVFLLPATAAAQERALTFSYRGMVGASVRYEAPVVPGVVGLVEGGVSSWLVYGDDPSAGANQSPIVVRPHVKLGADLHIPESEFFVGARGVVARDETFLTGVPSWEAAPQATVGWKSVGKPVRSQVGLGIGPHFFWRTDETTMIWMPHLEVRFGPAWPTSP